MDSTEHSGTARPCPLQEGEELELREGVWRLFFLILSWRMGQSAKPLPPLCGDLGRTLGKGEQRH